MVKHIIVIGRVQGVGFRYATQQKARQLNLNGWIQNKEDGTVEIEVEGDSTKMEELINAIKSGLNPFMRVEKLTVHNIDTSKGYSGFSIK
ncbi:acylphosphatase [Oceanobacillus halotolerans]|uniref:acylphosphatase n=1 Tax=Oceanobacillus halotolerans TaxID=2663380 RepID=UPI0013DBAC6D|nr:acylphosphatase [Oceanobacillus halotolerans]